MITTPRAPLPWINYLGSEDFFSLVSNTAGGYSFYRDAKLLRLTSYRYNSAPADGEGHRFYIRDGACVWNPGWQPVRTELDSYRCRHGLGYTVIEGAKNGIEAKQEMFVPLSDACEVIRLTLHNAGAQAAAATVQLCGVLPVERIGWVLARQLLAPARWRLRAEPSIIKRNTASAAATMPCSA